MNIVIVFATKYDPKRKKRLHEMKEVYVLYLTNVWKEKPASIYALCFSYESLQKAILRGLKEEKVFTWDENYSYEPEEAVNIYEINQGLQYGFVETMKVE